jgi:hypothetical protein
MKYLLFLSSFIFFQIHLPGQNDDWHQLFNGTDLSGWEIFGDFDARIIDRELVLRTTARQRGGWLLTEYSFNNFRLEAECLSPLPNNTGIAIRHDDSFGGDPAYSGCKINVHHEANQQNPTGSIVDLARAVWIDTLNPGNWISIAVEANGDHLQTWVNGIKVAETHSRRSLQGKIGLQASGGPRAGEVRFRNIRIKTLPDASNPVPLIEDYLRNTHRRSFVSLFDGRTLAGWDEDGDGYWEVEDGAIHGKGGVESAWLITHGLYRNFYLKLKFRIAKEENSGVFIRNDPNADDVGLDTGLECNIYDHDGYLHAYSTGSIVTHARAWSNMVDYDDWNSMEIFAFEDQVTMYINGLKSTETHFPGAWNREGTICLQAGLRVFTDNGPSDVWFKDIYIKNMDGIPFLGY